MLFHQQWSQWSQNSNLKTIRPIYRMEFQNSKIAIFGFFLLHLGGGLADPMMPLWLSSATGTRERTVAETLAGGGREGNWDW